MSPQVRAAAATVAAGVVYLALAVAWTWPYPLHAADTLPNGINPTSLPASAGTWALWWVADRAAHGFVGFWDAPIFFPADDTFGYSEPSLPLGLAVAPLFWLGLSPGVAYAAVVLGSLALNGLSARWLAKVLGAGEVAAGVAGAWLVTCSMTWKWLAVMPLVPLFPILWFVGACVRAARDPDWRGGLAVGASLALTWLICLQYGYFLTLCAPVLLLLARPRRAHAEVLGAAALLAALLLAPVLVPQSRILAREGMERSAERAERGGGSLTGMWMRAPVPPRLGIVAPLSGEDGPRLHPGMYPGTVLVLLVLASGVLRRREREHAVLVAAVILSVALSVLPTLELGGWRPYEWLRDWLPGLGRIREPRRAASLAMALLPVLAAPALDVPRGRWRALPVLALVVALANEWPLPMPTQPLPDRDPAWIAVLEQQVGDGVVTFLPIEDGTPTPEVDRMIVQIAHGRRMTNGYSSYYPRSYWQLRRLAVPSPKPRLWDELRRVGVTHVACPEGWLPAGAALTEVGRAGGNVLYRL